MPKFLEDALEKAAAAKGMTGRDADRYVYGAMNNMGAMKGNKETAKGARMQVKHNRDVGRQQGKRISAAVAGRLRGKVGKMLDSKPCKGC